ncbi:MAG: DUF6334 family protein [Salinivirgaceae bacterium]|jgi:hypothetical protein
MEIDIIGKRIKSVKVINSQENCKYYERLFLYLDDLVLDVTVDNSNDELIFKKQNSKYQLEEDLIEPEWSNKLIEGTINSFWECQNNMGYNDLFILGINESFPTVCIYSIASQIEIRMINPININF